MIGFESSSNNLNKETLEALEQYWEFKFPNDYESFLLKYNGGCPNKTHFNFKNAAEGSVIQAFLGITPKKYLNLLIEIRSYRNRVPKNTFPIAYDVFGNLILLSVKGSDRGKVYFWDHEKEVTDGQVPDYSNLTLIADSFEEFLNSLHTPD